MKKITVEDILVRYFGKNSNENYGILISLLYDLDKLGAIKNVNEIVGFLDELFPLSIPF